MMLYTVQMYIFVRKDRGVTLIAPRNQRELLLLQTLYGIATKWFADNNIKLVFIPKNKSHERRRL